MKPITGVMRKRAKTGITMPAAPRMTSASPSGVEGENETWPYPQAKRWWRICHGRTRPDMERGEIVMGWSQKWRQLRFAQ
jgi:hypothetical protein